MRDTFSILFVLFFVASCSCNQAGMVNDAHVILAQPDKSVCLDPDSSFNCRFAEVQDCQWVQIVADSVLVLQDKIYKDNDFFFSAYSLDNLEFLGHFVACGRGPGEMLSPHVLSTNTSNSLLVCENGEGYLVDIDVIKSVEDVKSSTDKRINLPGNKIDCIPLTDSAMLLSLYENDRMLFHIKHSDTGNDTTINLYNESVAGAITHLSAVMTNNTTSGIAAIFMLHLPQVVFVDEDGNVKVVAVDKRFKQWETVFSQMFGPETIQYYSGVSSDRKYIYATYLDMTLKDAWDAQSGTSIQIFDWDGDYLYEIKVKESVDCPAIDSRSHFLYCRNRSDHSIVRYDLSGLKLSM